MIEYVKKCLTLYATFDGRARRAEYWYFYLFSFLAAFVGGLIDGFVGLTFIALIINIALFIPGIAAACRRMHDVGKSGWFMLIPFYNLYLAVTDGDKGPNKYGPDPKGGTAVAGSFGDSEVIDDQML